MLLENCRRLTVLPIFQLVPAPHYVPPVFHPANVTYASPENSGMALNVKVSSNITCGTRHDSPNIIGNQSYFRGAGWGVQNSVFNKKFVLIRDSVSEISLNSINSGFSA